MKRVFRLVHRQARDNALECVREAQDGWVVVVQEPTRSLSSNAAMWVVLEAFSRQLQWPVNGEMVYMTPAEWKDVLSACFLHETRIAQGIDGGTVLLGQKTSEFTVRQMSEFLEFAHSVAADRNVKI